MSRPLRVFVVCPPAHATGGPEALHQFGAAAISAGFDASMVYLPNHPDPVHPRYLGYKVPVSTAVIDSPHSVVVVPEVFAPHLFHYTNAQRVLWWLSVDGFTTRSEAARQAAGTPTSPWRVVYQPGARVHHIAQSEYARAHVESEGCSAQMVTDYLPSSLTSVPETPLEERRGVIAYNPAKGLPLTNAVMARLPQYEWVPLHGMSSAELAATLRRACLYTDFGEHPGRDRLPREAAAAGCIVLVGQRGSADNPIDVPLPDELKVAVNPMDVEAVAQRIERLMADPESAVAAMEPYRKTILDQQAIFHDEVFTALAHLGAAT